MNGNSIDNLRNVNSRFIDNLRYTGQSPQYTDQQYQRLSGARDVNESATMSAVGNLGSLLTAGVLAGLMGRAIDTAALVPKLVSGKTSDLNQFMEQYTNTIGSNSEMSKNVEKEKKSMKRTGEKAKEAKKEQGRRANEAQKAMAKLLDPTSFLSNLRSK